MIDLADRGWKEKNGSDEGDDGPLTMRPQGARESLKLRVLKSLKQKTETGPLTTDYRPQTEWRLDKAQQNGAFLRKWPQMLVRACRRPVTIPWKPQSTLVAGYTRVAVPGQPAELRGLERRSLNDETGLRPRRVGAGGYPPAPP